MTVSGAHLAALVDALNLILEPGVSWSGVTVAEADMLHVRGMDKEPGLLGAFKLIRMRDVAVLGEVVLGEVGNVGGESNWR